MVPSNSRGACRRGRGTSKGGFHEDEAPGSVGITDLQYSCVTPGYCRGGGTLVRRGGHEFRSSKGGLLSTRMINSFWGYRHDQAGGVTGIELLPSSGGGGSACGNMSQFDASSAFVAATADKRAPAIHSIPRKILPLYPAISSIRKSTVGLRQWAFASMCESRTRA